ncbi:MAG: gliding motility-associated C-terminal domain-containing protein, partial [Chitinophagaceae bacterium]|nr:gliding motility-associated C-terminal domain-containing protein [Chitinophagaceae bacterium]
NYEVKLVVTNTQGCVSDTAKKNIRVWVQPIIDAGPWFIVPQNSVITMNPTANDSTTVTFRWTPAIDFATPNILRPSLTAIRDQVYTLTATAQGNCRATDTVSVKVLKEVIIPNAFSPNGDGVNDKWDIRNLGDYSFATVEIFNRYGQVVFQSNGYSAAWDGTLNGKALPVATYYYIIKFNNRFPTRSGSVTIIR